ncbi:hypothetical protein Tco_0622608 [Tanacetum coccineum]
MIIHCGKQGNQQVVGTIRLYSSFASASRRVLYASFSLSVALVAACGNSKTFVRMDKKNDLSVRLLDLEICSLGSHPKDHIVSLVFPAPHHSSPGSLLLD